MNPVLEEPLFSDSITNKKNKLVEFLKVYYI